jgi:hypothetical protein
MRSGPNEWDSRPRGLGVRQVGEAQVALPVAHPLRNRGVLALAQVEADGGVQAPEVEHGAGEKVPAHAGEGANRDGGAPQALDLALLLGKRPLVASNCLQVGHELLAVLGEGDTVAAALHKRAPKLALQRFDRLRDGALRVANAIGDLGEAARLDNVDKD